MQEKWSKRNKHTKYNFNKTSYGYIIRKRVLNLIQIQITTTMKMSVLTSRSRLKFGALSFVEGRKLESSEKKLSEKVQESLTKTTHVITPDLGFDTGPQNGGKLVLSPVSPLRLPCFAIASYEYRCRAGLFPDRTQDRW